MLDAVAPRFDQSRSAFGFVAAHVAALARDLARAREDDVALALGELDAELEALVVFLEDHDVPVDGSAQPVTPYLVRTHSLVGPHIEEGAAVRGPGGSVIHVAEDILEVAAGGKVSKTNFVQLVACQVDGVREGVFIRAALDA